MLKKYTNGSWSEIKYKKYGNKAEEFAEFPVTIKGDGNDLTDYNISGNMSQASGVSPTTPIQPQETGERTGNLAYKIIENANISPEGLIASVSGYNIMVAKVTQGQAYSGTGYVYAFFNDEPDIRSTSYNESRVVNNFKNVTAPISGYVAVRYAPSENPMINTGSTALPYENFGYKIPISSANTTTPVYLGEVETTRRIRKLVLTGDETITTGSVIGQMRTSLTGAIDSLGYCTHYILKTVYGGDFPYIRIRNNTLWIEISPDGYETKEEAVADFKAYLAQQYANGTPVTIWYVLATPTTGIVNEPLRKIGDYADTVSYEQAGVQIPTLHGNTVIDVETELKPSEMSLTYKTWSEANAKIYLNGAWTDTPTPPVTSVVYGWHVDPSIADSSDAVTYLEDAVGMTPAAMGASTFDYGSWENAFFMPKPCMVRSNGEVAYYLDPNDYSKKADGTPSDVANPDFDGNAMMEWGKIWYKFAGGETDGEGYFYVSNVQVDESYHCWCNYDSKDNITDHFYTAIYNGTGTTKLRSISGVALTSANGNGDTTATQEVERATANNTTADVEWYTDVWADRLLINALLVLIGKSLNTQATFGRGLDMGDQTAKETYATGTLDDKGLFWGVTTDGNSAVKVFGMENWWGCVWHRTAGCISIDRALKIKLTYGTADGSTVVGYNQTGSGYISDGTIPSSGGYVRAMVYNQYGYAPNNTSGGSPSTYYTDYFSQSTGIRYLLAGGSSSNGFASGAFYFNLYNESSTVGWNRAASLSFKPLAK